MNVKKTYSDIQKLSNLLHLLGKRDLEAVNELKRIYQLVFNDMFELGCSNCHIRAYKELISLTLEDLIKMENQNFKLKKTALIEYPAGSAVFYSAKKGISDKDAIDYLTAIPKRIDQFEEYPKNADGSVKLTKESAKKKEEAVKEDKKD